MNPLFFKIVTASFLVVLVVGSTWALRSVEVVFHTETAAFADLARQMNIRNMVSAVYLGPRIIDTFFEVMVVVLAVFGMKFVREGL